MEYTRLRVPKFCVHFDFLDTRFLPFWTRHFPYDYWIFAKCVQKPKISAKTIYINAHVRKYDMRFAYTYISIYFGVLDTNDIKPLLYKDFSCVHSCVQNYFWTQILDTLFVYSSWLCSPDPSSPEPSSSHSSTCTPSTIIPL